MRTARKREETQLSGVEDYGGNSGGVNTARGIHWSNICSLLLGGGEVAMLHRPFAAYSVWPLFTPIMGEEKHCGPN